jgi:hypothetical protein
MAAAGTLPQNRNARSDKNVGKVICRTFATLASRRLGQKASNEKSPREAEAFQTRPERFELPAF